MASENNKLCSAVIDQYSSLVEGIPKIAEQWFIKTLDQLLCKVKS